jgi:alcohol dehydrogenase class IV
MLPEYFEFTLPTKLIYGIGILGKLEGAVRPFGKRRAILVTDKILAKAGPADKVKAGFKGSTVDIVCTYDKVPPNSTIKTVEGCAAMAVKHGCDMIIAVGGGSVIDTAKVANILIVKGGRVEEHMGAYLLDKNERLLPAIFIPTTAGTGSEVTKVAVIADPAHDVKLPFAEDQFLPDLAILDPEVTVSMPPKITAATGMDALTHAIEAYVDKEWSPASDAMALHAIKLISANILLACAHPENLQARGGMLIGSFLAGVAFSHSMVGMTHGISHALGGVYHIPHGLANALILPEVMEYNLEAQPDRYADIAVALGVSFPQLVTESRNLLKADSMDLVMKLVSKMDFAYLRDKVSCASTWLRGSAADVVGTFGFIDHWFRHQAARAGIEKIRMLNRQLAYLTEMPLNLEEAGIDDDLDRLDQVVTTAMEDGSMLYNPIEPTREMVEDIVRKAFASQDRPLHVSKRDLHPQDTTLGGGDMTNVFKDSRMLYDIISGFFEVLRNDEDLGPALAGTNLVIQFIFKNPSAVITIDTTGDEIEIHTGDYEGKPEVSMTMNADFAHKFWHGRANLVTALTMRQVVAKGNVPKTLKLLPILKPAYDMYPRFLKDKGLEHLVML